MFVGRPALLLKPATEITAMVRQREVSALAVTEPLLQRIERVNPMLNVIVAVAADGALIAAEEVDRAAADWSRPRAQQGAPMTIKDSIQVAGMRTTWGEPAFKDYVADWDPTVVRRLKEAGALIIG